MEVREIRENEVSEFHRVFRKIIRDEFPEYPAHVRDFFISKDFREAFLEKRIKNWDYVVLIAADEGRIVGFLVMEKLYGGVSFATWLGVVREYQGKGAGSLLVRAWEKRVREEGGHKLMLIAPSEKVREFYLHQNFTEEGFEKKSWFGIDYWLFGKIIAGPRPELFLKYIRANGLPKK